MTDDRRLFRSTFYGGRVRNSRSAYQDQPASDAPPLDSLKDLQQLLGRLLAEQSESQQAHHISNQHHSRSWSQQEKPQVRGKSYYHTGESVDEPSAAAVNASIQLRHRGRPDFAAPRVRSAGGADALERQYRVGDIQLMGEGRQRQGVGYDHWFSDKHKDSEEGVTGFDRWRQTSDASSNGGGVGFEVTPIPVIDRRREGHHRTTSERISRVPQSPSWPLTSCVVQQREFTHREGPTTIYQEVESSDLRPIGQGIHSLEDSPRQEASTATLSGRHRASGWWPTIPSSADASLQRRHQSRGAVPISAKREATLRASAEQLDSLVVSAAAPAPPPATPSWHHRRTTSTGADRPAVNLDYEGTRPMGDGRSRLFGDDASSMAGSSAEATMPLWYRPDISREKAIAVLKEAPPGSFLIRDSLTYQGAFGLAMRIAQRQQRAGGGTVGEGGQPLAVAGTRGDELVRHFLIEQQQQQGGGVRLRGCANEPVFASLAELVQCHCQVALALPCRLRLPTGGTAAATTTAAAPPPQIAAPRTLQRRSDSVDETARRGNTYRVLYFCTVDVPNGRTNLTSAASTGWGADAVTAAVNQVVTSSDVPKPVECRMRVNGKGVKLSGLGWHREFRLAYAAQDCSVCRLDSDGRRYSDLKSRTESRLFGLVVRKYGLYGNQSACLVLGDLESVQPAAGIAAFVNRCVRGAWENRKERLIY